MNFLNVFMSRKMRENIFLTLREFSFLISFFQGVKTILASSEKVKLRQ
jgi:hypothetical protein